MFCQVVLFLDHFYLVAGTGGAVAGEACPCVGFGVDFHAGGVVFVEGAF